MYNITGVFMKKLIITLLFLIPFVSGCARINTNLTINKNKSAQVEVKMLSTKDASPLERATMDFNIKRFIDKGYLVNDESTYKKINVTAHKRVKNLSKDDLDLSSLGFVSKLESGRFIDVNHNFFVTSYNIHMVYNLAGQKNKIYYVKDLTKKPGSKTGLIPEYLQKYGDTSEFSPDAQVIENNDFEANFDRNFVYEDDIKEAKTKEIEVKDDYKLFDINNLNSRFTVTLPSFASYNNADKIENGVYVWEISPNKPTEIKLQYVVYSGFAITLLFLAGILFLIYVARRVHRHDTLKRIGNSN